MNPETQRLDRPSGIRRCVVLAALLLIAVFVWRGAPVAKVAQIAGLDSVLHSVPTRAAARKAYPLSVIYGGAYSGEELARARGLDAVIARHYAGFGSSPTVTHMPKDAFLYVSYRKSNQVFWTKTKRRIPAGETVLSDGQNLARTRCGNRLSPTPQAPVASGAADPTDEALDVPDGPKPSLVAANPVPSVPEADFFIPANSTDVVSSLSPAGPGSAPPSSSGGASGAWEAPYVFRFPFGGGGGGPFTGNSLFYPALTGSSSSGSSGAAYPATVMANDSPGSDVVTPEPSTLPLLLLGILLGAPAVLRQWRDRADTTGRK